MRVDVAYGFQNEHEHKKKKVLTKFFMLAFRKSSMKVKKLVGIIGVSECEIRMGTKVMSR